MPKVHFDRVDRFDEDDDSFSSNATMRRRNNPAEEVKCPSCQHNPITRGERDNGHLCEDCESYFDNQDDSEYAA